MSPQSGCLPCGSETGDGVWLCRRCLARLVVALDRLGPLVPELEVTRSGQDRVRSGLKRSGVPLHEQGVSTRPDVTLVLRGLAGVLDRWTTYVWSIDPDNAVDDDPDWWDVAPESTARLVGQVAYLRRSVGRIRCCQRAGDIFAEVTTITSRAGRAVDIPSESSRFEVGPCPEWISPDPARESSLASRAYACEGTVHAVIGSGDRASVMRCDNAACGRSWGTAEWYRAGRRILTRKLEIDRASRAASGRSA